MNAENTNKLLTAFPRLYRELRAFGFECGDGWFGLVWQLSSDIESTARLAGIPENSDAWPSVEILKQKFGALRVSFAAPVGEDIDVLVAKAEKLSSETCESCAAPGYRERQRRWVKTLCETCRKAQSW